jgi:hypothetical protein
MEILSISCKFIELMEFIKDELHIILNSWSLIYNIIITWIKHEIDRFQTA